MGWNCCHVPDISYLLSNTQQHPPNTNAPQRMLSIYNTIILLQVVSKGAIWPTINSSRGKNEDASFTKQHVLKIHDALYYSNPPQKTILYYAPCPYAIGITSAIIATPKTILTLLYIF